MRADEPFCVRTVDELFDREQEILERLGRRRNGGLLFTLAPVRLLSDLGVELEPPVLAWIEEHEPAALGRTAPGAYEAVAGLEEDASVVVHVDGLFRPRDQ